MKILFVHNFYISTAPSGEDIVFKDELELLKKKGIEVITYTKYNDEILSYRFKNKLQLPINIVWSLKSYKELKSIIKKEKPDLCHFHNIFYTISTSAYYACKDAGVPVVQTLHNYRIFCVNGLLFRNGKTCEDCIGRIPYNAFLNGCYRNSRTSSLVMAFMEYLHRIIGTWNTKIDAFIILTEFSKSKFIKASLPAEKIFVKPNFIKNNLEPHFNFKKFVLFVGRLTSEKGVMTLLKSWKKIDSKGIVLKIIGDGSLKKDIEEFIIKHKLENVKICGYLPWEEVIENIKNSMFLFFTSECYETFGKPVIEAFACGKPIIASRLGVMEEIVEDGKTGLFFEPGNPDDLALKIKWMLDNTNASIEMGKNARAEFEAKYTFEKNFEILIGIYQKAI